MFRNTNLNNSPLNFFYNIKRMLINQQSDYINLLSENRRMLEEIDNYIYEYETRRQPRSARRVLTFEEILRYTTAHHFNEIEEPLNTRCPITNIVFRGDDWVCKLPCGHLFDGSSICYHLTHINSMCPLCNRDVIPRSNTAPNLQFTLRQPNASYDASLNSLYDASLNTTNFMSSLNLVDELLTSRTSLSSLNLVGNILLSNILPNNSGVDENDTALTNEEISNATEEIQYGNIENPLSQHCPISYTEFDDDTEVIRIRHCQHIFERTSLMTWLQRHNTCPVCRYNLRTRTRINTNTNANANTNTNENMNVMREVRNGYTTYYYFR